MPGGRRLLHRASLRSSCPRDMRGRVGSEGSSRPASWLRFPPGPRRSGFLNRRLGGGDSSWLRRRGSISSSSAGHVYGGFDFGDFRRRKSPSPGVLRPGPRSPPPMRLPTSRSSCWRGWDVWFWGIASSSPAPRLRSTSLRIPQPFSRFPPGRNDCPRSSCLPESSSASADGGKVVPSRRCSP